MDNKLLGTLLGDSYLGKNSSFRCTHSNSQRDYLLYKQLILKESMINKSCICDRKERDVAELYVKHTKFKKLRDKYYPNGKKSLINILKDIDNPKSAVAMWLMDDGCIHYSTKNKTRLSPRLLLATCIENNETMEFIIKWFQKEFNLNPYISTQKNNSRETTYKLIKFTVGDSYLLWEKIKNEIPDIYSMNFKFRVIKSEFQHEFYRKKYIHESPTS